MLAALVALPVIWYFLRLMPPKPRLEQFPPTRLLLEIARKEEQPSRSPWWLTALRLAARRRRHPGARRPRCSNRPAEQAPGDGPLLLVVDNGWASAPNWQATLDTAHRILDLAEPTEPAGRAACYRRRPRQSLAPGDADEVAPAARRAGAAAVAARDHAELTAPVRGGGDGDAASAASHGCPTAWAATTQNAFAAGARGAASTDRSWPMPTRTSSCSALKPPVGSRGRAERAGRSGALGRAGERRCVRASDVKGRVIGEAPVDFAAGDRDGRGQVQAAGGTAQRDRARRGRRC